jgi:hypothetical protein
VPLAVLLRDHFPALLAGAAAVVACFAIFYLSTAFALARATSTLGYSREQFLGIQLGANCFLALGIVLAAIRADRVGGRSVLALGALATTAIGIGFGAGLEGGPGFAFATLASALLVMGFVYGPLGGWLPTLFPVPVRYSGISVAFNTGGIIGGALTPLLAQRLSDAGHGSAIGLILCAAGVLSFVGVMLARPPRAAT